jgi:hypothetical protein
MFLVGISACLEDEAIPLDDFLQPIASGEKVSDVFSDLNENTQMIKFKANFLSGPTNIPTLPIFMEEGFLKIDFTADGQSSHFFFTQVDLNSKLFSNEKPPWKNSGTFYLMDQYGNKLPASFTGMADRLPNSPLASSGHFVIKPGKGKYENLKGQGSYEFFVIPNLYSDAGFVTIEVRISGVLTILAPGYFGDN